MSKNIVLFLVMLAATGIGFGAEVSIVHGIPNLDVDIYVEGELLLEAFTFTTVAGPLALPAGDYAIEIFAAGADPESTDPALALTASIVEDQQVALVAHLKEDGTPTVTPFGMNFGPVSRFSSRVALRHAAAAPPVDIRFESRNPFLRGAFVWGLSNQASSQSLAYALDYDVVFALPGTTDPAVDVIPLTLKGGTTYVAYAVGSLADGTFTVILQVVDSR